MFTAIRKARGAGYRAGRARGRYPENACRSINPYKHRKGVFNRFLELMWDDAYLDGWNTSLRLWLQFRALKG